MLVGLSITHVSYITYYYIQSIIGQYVFLGLQGLNGRACYASQGWSKSPDLVRSRVVPLPPATPQKKIEAEIMGI